MMGSVKREEAREKKREKIKPRNPKNANERIKKNLDQAPKAPRRERRKSLFENIGTTTSLRVPLYARLLSCSFILLSAK